MPTDVRNSKSPQFLLEVVAGPETGREIPLPFGDLVIGRASHCSITLNHDGVAPTHCGLRVRAEQVIVAPGGTVNVTLLNGEKLARGQLMRLGDELGIGAYRLVLRMRIDEVERRFYPGDQIGPYRILAEIGSGAVGRVYEARGNGRTVALKTLRVRSDWEKRTLDHRRALFRREAEALRRIDHPHVVRSYGSGDHGGVQWLAMELVQGPTLREFLITGRPSVAQVERMMFQLCSAVAAVHDARVIHRDLKPANVLLVGPERRICLADFGLAQLLGAPKLEELDPPHYSSIIRVGRQVGTPAYMPPEQTQGEDANLRSDVWSLGVLLYELISARRPFPGSDLRQVLTRVCKACPEPLPNDVEPYLRGVVYKCLQKRSAWRFANAHELVDALHDRRVVQYLPVGVDGPNPQPLTGCPHCAAPITHPLTCGRCGQPLFRYTDGQVLTVPLQGAVGLACGTCGTVVKTDSSECPNCAQGFTDLPPAGQTRSAATLHTGGPLVVDVFDQAIDLLEKCPYCEQPRAGKKKHCPHCGFLFRAYVTSRLKRDLAVGGWSLYCGECGTAVPEADDPICPGCGLGFGTGQFPDGTRHLDDLPPELQRKLQG